jgi:hypothetical protein
MESERSTSLSFFSPSGVSSKAQAKARVGIRPMARTMVVIPSAASPKPNAGKMVSTT